MNDDLAVFPPKKGPTKVKHFLLDKYLSAWGGIIVNSNTSDIRLCFVDTCCGSGLYQSDADGDDDQDPYEPGSAILGPSKLKELVDYGESRQRRVTARALLINNKKRELETVRQALPAGVRERVEVIVHLKRFDEVKDEIVQACAKSFSFVLIDPYGPTPTPFTAVRDVVKGRYTDTLINFPFFSLQKWGGFIEKKDRAPWEDARLRAADDFMGGTEWRGLPQVARQSGRRLDDLLVEHYVALLAKQGVLAIALPLYFENAARVLYHLVFTSHNIAGFAAAKSKFAEARDQQFRLREDARFRKTGQMSILTADGMDSGNDVDINELATLLVNEFSDRVVPFEEVLLRGLREGPILEPHIRKALTKLKAEGYAVYASRNYNDVVTFKRAPSKRS